jgi:cobalamin synthase
LEPADHIMIQTFTRFGVLIPALTCSYPRESGTGKFFVENVNGKTVWGALTLTVIVAAGIYFLYGRTAGRLIITGAGLCIAVIVPLLTGWWSNKKIGGITGDVLGFTVECSHLAIVTALIVSKVN